MSSTWRYLSEARGHLIEIYELLLAMPLHSPQRLLVGMHPPADLVEANMKASREWHDQRFEKLMHVVEVLDQYNIAGAIADWRDHAIDFLGKTPSARSKMKFEDDADRIVFLSVVLWYARVAVEWLDAREEEGILQGGSSYREMTARAAGFGSLGERIDQTATDILPEESSMVDDLEEDDPKLAHYQKWSYIAVGLGDFF